MAQEVLLYLSIIVAISALLTILARIIKQPPIIAYIIAGILSGPLFLNFIGPSSTSSELIQIFAHLGVAFLLFIVGFSLDFRVLKEFGAVATIGGFFQILLTEVVGYFISLGLGFSSISSIYIATALAFSSTVIVIKILSDKKEIHTLHARIALGILIVQDFVAALALMAIPLINSQTTSNKILTDLGIILLLIFAVFVFANYILNRIMDYLARSQEVLFLFGIAWALIIAAIFDTLGFSLEIGALIAGMSLASSRYTLELGGKIKPLRDFFVVLFFVFFGSQLSGAITWPLIQKALILSLFVLIGKPLIVMIILRLFGYKKRTNFLASISLAQISEFSLILALLGFSLGHLSQEIMTLSILIALITITLSSYSIYYSENIFNRISSFLLFFEGKKEQTIKKEKSYKILLFGYHRIGFKLLQTIKKLGLPYAIVDYNPKVILTLEKQGIPCIYGDAEDKELLSELNLEEVKLIISTIPDSSSNISIKESLNKINSKAVFIATAEQPKTAIDLYENGVDYVIIPHHLGGDYASNLIENFKVNSEKYKTIGKQHQKELSKSKNNSSF